LRRICTRAGKRASATFSPYTSSFFAMLNSSRFSRFGKQLAFLTSFLMPAFRPLWLASPTRVKTAYPASKDWTPEIQAPENKALVSPSPSFETQLKRPRVDRRSLFWPFSPHIGQLLRSAGCTIAPSFLTQSKHVKPCPLWGRPLFLYGGKEASQILGWRSSSYVFRIRNLL
jgi:hypothetical protein